MTGPSAWMRRYGVQSAAAAIFVAVGLLAPSTSPPRQNEFATGAIVGGPSATSAEPGAADASGEPATGDVAGSPSAIGPAPLSESNPGSNTGSAASAGEDCTRESVLGARYGCRPLFDGANGGATYEGVTADRLTVVSYQPAGNAQLDAIVSSAGFALSDEQSEAIRRELIEWVGANFQTYGRSIDVQRFQSSAGPTDAAAHRAEAVEIATDRQPFLVVGAFDTNFIDELARRGVVCFCGVQLPAGFLVDRAPFVYGSLPDGGTTNRLIVDWMNRRLGPTSAATNGGPDINGQPRRIGIIHPNDSVNLDNARGLAAMLAKSGWAVVGDAGYASDINTATQQATNIAQQMRTAGVTSVICVCDPIAPYFIYEAFTAQQYFPEHIQSGYSYQDLDEVVRFYDRRQVEHSFGVSMLPVRRPPEQQAFWTVYERQFGRPPESQSAALAAEATFGALLEIFHAIEAAGPILHPGTLRDGRFGSPLPNSDPFSPAVSYSASDFGGVDDAREVWWDPTGSGADGRAGTYQSVNGGRRYVVGQFPAGPSPAFRAECTGAGTCGGPS